MTTRTNEVYTSELLQSLQRATSHEPFAQCALEAFNIGRLSETHLVEMVGLHFIQFFNDCRVIHGQTAQLCQGFSSLVISICFDQITWCLWQEEEAAGLLDDFQY